MPDSDPPRIRVHLPGDAPARLHRWRQDPATGEWWAELTLYAPAATVQQLPGEDYTQVPRESASVGLVLQALPGGRVIHRTDCWAASGGRLTPLAGGGQALDLAADGAELCEMCTPEP